MSTLQGNVYGSLAVASVAPLTPGAFLDQRGFDDLFYNGPGDVTLTLENGCDPDKLIVRTGPNHNLGTHFVTISVEPLTTTTMRVRSSGYTAAQPPLYAAATGPFWIEIDQFSPT